MSQELESRQGDRRNQEIAGAEAIEPPTLDEIARRNRLLWRCRQGTRELDVLLTDFLVDHAERFTVSEITIFEAILNHSNAELMQWLLTEHLPEDAQIAAMVMRIRCYRQKLTDGDPYG